MYARLRRECSGNHSVIGFTSVCRAASLHYKSVRTVFQRITELEATMERVGFGGDKQALGQESQGWGFRTIPVGLLVNLPNLPEPVSSARKWT